MKFSVGSNLAGVLLMAACCADASFLRDVVGRKSSKEKRIENALFDKAIPLAEYREKLRANGMDFEGNEHRNLNYYDYQYNRGADDDYYKVNNGNDDVNDDYVQYTKNFNSYALKYAKCQPVQRFSEEAVVAGEASPMLTDDIVILRLCSTKSCSASKTFGCLSNYAEYAISLTDYVQIMIYYREDRMDQLCDWCSSCYSRRNLNNNNNNGNNANNNYNNGDDANGNNNYNNDDAAGGDDAWGGYTHYGNDCTDYKSYCYDSDNGYSVCEEYKDSDSSIYLNYLNCVNVQDADNYNYYIRPRCDGNNQIIHMGLFYDNFCSQYAGDKVDIDDFNLGFDDSDFEEFYTDLDCLDCTKSNDPPNFMTTHSLCSQIHSAGATCTQRLSDNYLQSNEDSSVCVFIQSMKNGNYDGYGSLDQGEAGILRHVTDQEKALLVFSIFLIVLLVAFATYLHGQVTDVLIESMAHSELLPSSKDNNKTSRKASRVHRKPRSKSKTRTTVRVAPR